MIENLRFPDSCYHKVPNNGTHWIYWSFFPSLFSHVSVAENIWILIIFVSFSGITIKTPCIVHKNVSVYCVEFQCTKKQTILLLEVWHQHYNSKFLRFILFASFYSSSVGHNEITTKTKKLHAFMKVSVFSIRSHMKPQSVAMLCSTPKRFCNTDIHVQVKEIYSLFFLENSFRHPRSGTHTCLPRKHVFQWFPEESGMSLKLFPLLQAKATLNFLFWPLIALSLCLECHSFQTNSLLQSNQFN